MVSQQGGSGGVHRADPAYRRQMIVCLMVFSMGGAIMLFVLVHWLNGLTTDPSAPDPAKLAVRLQQLMAALCLLLASGSAGLSHWLYRAAVQTRKEKRWPPTGMQTTADIPVRYLSSAESVARQLQLGFLVFAGLAAGTAGWAAWILLL